MQLMQDLIGTDKYNSFYRLAMCYPQNSPKCVKSGGNHLAADAIIIIIASRQHEQLEASSGVRIPFNKSASYHQRLSLSAVYCNIFAYSYSTTGCQMHVKKPSFPQSLLR